MSLIKMENSLKNGEYKISWPMIENVFNNVLAEKISREDARNWAFTLMEKEDLGLLRYNPVSDENKIWAGISFLLDVDGEIAPNNYLYSFSDIREELDSLNKEE